MADDRPLYHYTNFAGLKGIIDSRSLWLTDYRALNDHLELQYVDAFIRELFLNSYKSHVDSSGFCEEVFKLIEANEVDFLSRAFNEPLSHGIFIFSLSQHSDPFVKRNGLLSMWREYGKEGGCALVFNYKKFEKFLKNAPLGPTSDHVRYYDLYASPPEKFDDEINKHVEKLTSAIDCLIRAWLVRKSNKMETKCDGTVGDILSSSFYLRTFLKHPGFKEEEEYRVFVFEVPEKYRIHSSNPPILNTRLHDGRLVSYVEISFKMNSLEKIIIGPQTNQDKTEKYIRDYLKSQNLDVMIQRSETPYLMRV